ncbi:MAG: hypothetical protein KAV87_60495 [Desulfobacteraceae bacterium]|nr:hypothetical protein [Desulfobacteraceae bacterium]
MRKQKGDASTNCANNPYRNNYDAIFGKKEQFDFNVIPPITNSLGTHWDQPSAEDIKITDSKAIMTDRTLSRLANYSMSVPTGAYEGKMWRRNCGGSNWVLCWFVVDPKDSKYLLTCQRPIEIVVDV